MDSIHRNKPTTDLLSSSDKFLNSSSGEDTEYPQLDPLPICLQRWGMPVGLSFTQYIELVDERIETTREIRRRSSAKSKPKRKKFVSVEIRRQRKREAMRRYRAKIAQQKKALKRWNPKFR